MRRNLMAAAASSILALAAPSLALAHGGKHHHGARHASAHKRHGHRAHLLSFGGSRSGAGDTRSASTRSASGQPAGTVASFTGGVLTITLGDGSTVSGMVTETTKLECLPAASITESSGEQQQNGDDDQGPADGRDPGGPFSQAQDPGQRGVEAQSSDVGEDQGEDDDGQESCTTAALVHEAVVLKAELIVSGSGAVWKKIDLSQ